MLDTLQRTRKQRTDALANLRRELARCERELLKPLRYERFHQLRGRIGGLKRAVKIAEMLI